VTCYAFAANSRVNWMHAEDSQQQQQQSDGTPTENCLPQFKSSDPYLASILRHLRATDQRLDGTRCRLWVDVTDVNNLPDNVFWPVTLPYRPIMAWHHGVLRYLGYHNYYASKAAHHIYTVKSTHANMQT